MIRLGTGSTGLVVTALTELPVAAQFVTARFRTSAELRFNATPGRRAVPLHVVVGNHIRRSLVLIGLGGSYRFLYYRWRKTQLYLDLLKPPTPNEEDPEELTYGFSFREGDQPDEHKLQLWYKVGRILDFEDAEDAKSNAKPQLAALPEDQRENAQKLIGRLHNRIHTTLVGNYYEEKSQNYDKVLQVFVRANSAGQPLEYSDLLLATVESSKTNGKGSKRRCR